MIKIDWETGDWYKLGTIANQDFYLRYFSIGNVLQFQSWDTGEEKKEAYRIGAELECAFGGGSDFYSRWDEFMERLNIALDAFEFEVGSVREEKNKEKAVRCIVELFDSFKIIVNKIVPDIEKVDFSTHQVPAD